MGLHEKLETKARRGAAVAQDSPNPAAKPPSPKTPEEEGLIAEASMLSDLAIRSWKVLVRDRGWR
eukprot:2758633-Amphidinium_carterae.1